MTSTSKQKEVLINWMKMIYYFEMHTLDPQLEFQKFGAYGKRPLRCLQKDFIEINSEPKLHVSQLSCFFKKNKDRSVVEENDKVSS